MSFTNVADGTYTIVHDSGSFTNVAVTGGTATVTGLTAGSYDNLNLTIAGCLSTDDPDVTLSDPPTPTIAITGSSNPTTCSGSDGTIDLSFTNVADGTYTIVHDSGALPMLL